MQLTHSVRCRMHGADDARRVGLAHPAWWRGQMLRLLIHLCRWISGDASGCASRMLMPSGSHSVGWRVQRVHATLMGAVRCASLPIRLSAGSLAFVFFDRSRSHQPSAVCDESAAAAQRHISQRTTNCATTQDDAQRRNIAIASLHTHRLTIGRRPRCPPVCPSRPVVVVVVRSLPLPSPCPPLRSPMTWLAASTRCPSMARRQHRLVQPPRAQQPHPPLPLPPLPPPLPLLLPAPLPPPLLRRLRPLSLAPLRCSTPPSRAACRKRSCAS